MQLPATLTLAEAAQVLTRLEAEIAGTVDGAAVELDASALGDFDTSAIAVLLEVRRTALARGLAFRLQSPPPKLGQLAELYGVQELLGLGQAQASAA